jgi:hypothetical protein
MKDASRYPITTGYGYVAGYPINNGFHRGQDRAMPTGTPVIVNGVTIGLSGNTGLSTGPHLHIGKFVGGVVQHPQGGGFSLPNASVFDTGEDKTSGKFVRVGSGGAVWIYAHLSQINVTKGQALDDMSTVGEVEFNILFRRIIGDISLVTADDRKRWIGKETNTVIRAMEADRRKPVSVVNRTSVLEYVNKNLL